MMELENQHLATITGVSEPSKKTLVGLKTDGRKHIYSFKIDPPNLFINYKREKIASEWGNLVHTPFVKCSKLTPSVM